MTNWINKKYMIFPEFDFRNLILIVKHTRYSKLSPSSYFVLHEVENEVSFIKNYHTLSTLEFP